MGDIMSDKFNNREKNISNFMKRNRNKFLQPLITDDDFADESDAFFSAVKKRAKTEKPNNEKHSYFLSPIRGKIIDRSSFPVTSSKGKIDKQYDFLRREKKLNREDLKKKHGHEYYEFHLITNQLKEEQLKKTTPPKKEPPVKIEEKIVPQEEKQVENKINIIYEEEIEIDNDNNIITSYDDESNLSFFSDYDKIKSNIDNKSNIHITEFNEKRKELKEELRKIFADTDYSETKEVFYEDKFDYDLPKKEETPKKSFTISNDFVNLKQELDRELKSKVNDNQVIYNDLSTYQFPPIDLLHHQDSIISDDIEWIESQMEVLDNTFESFGIAAKTVGYTKGPTVTRYEIEPEPGTKVSRITALQDDIKLRLAASDIRIEAPISGKSTVGIEVPNKEVRTVTLREIITSNAYKVYKSPLKIALGLDIAGEPVFSDIGSMTHSLIAGSTGSGKSVCINSIIISILYNALPDEVKLVLIDPKKVEFSMYRDIPHLLTPVINDPKVATATLRWLSEEMDHRYELIESVGARDIRSYNLKRSRSNLDIPKLPYIVVIIDELADLMVIAANEVEEYIQRISQLARAAGIHLIVATQRPSTNVITGTIKTNIPTRISFKVSSAIDSRIILDDTGAEKLIGKGDMLLLDNGRPYLKRLQGSYITEEEIEKVTNFVKEQLAPDYAFTADDLLKKETDISLDYDEELFDEAVRFVIEMGEASASKIQRHFKVGYNRAARIIDLMEKYHIVGPQQSGAKPRDVLVTLDEYERMFL